MKTYNIRRKPRRGLLRETLLLLLLVIVAALAFSPVVWLYHALLTELGISLAQTAITFHVVLILGLVTIGMALGFAMDWLIRHRRFVFRMPHQGGWAEVLLRLWGYELQCEASPQQTEMAKEKYPDLHSASLPVETRRRRGRKPTFTLEYWLPIAIQWENRDPIRDAFTLGELIAEHLGTNSDGSPIVSEQTYYSTWRDRAIEELQRRAQSGKKPAGIAARTQN